MTQAEMTTVLVNAAVTIITTYVVTRITLNNGTFAPAVKLQSLAKRYRRVALDLVLLALTAYFLGTFLASDAPIRRIHVVFIPLHLINLLAFLLFTALDLRDARKAAGT